MSKAQPVDQIDSKILEEFSVHFCIGQGGYGKVWKVTKRQTNKVYALKKVYDAFRNDTDAQRAYRQIKYLQMLRHPNIVSLQSFHLQQKSPDLYLILEFMDSDLSSAIRSGVLQQIHKHFIFYQICNGLQYLHSAKLIHQDLKPTNVLVNQSCEVKICDFGLIRSLVPSDPSKQMKFTQNIATRWYRAPQILLCTNNYGKPVDIWGLGCILAQIFMGKPIFQGTSAVSQLEKIFEVTGKPSRQQLYFVKSEASKSIVESMNVGPNKNLQDVIGRKDKQLIDLLQKIFVIDPAKRITIQKVMQHPFVKIFKGRAEQRKAQDYIKILYEEKKLNLENYRTLLLSQLQQKNPHMTDPSTSHESLVTQSLKNNVRQNILDPKQFSNLHRFSPQKQVKNAFGDNNRQFQQNFNKKPQEVVCSNQETKLNKMQGLAMEKKKSEELVTRLNQNNLQLKKILSLEPNKFKMSIKGIQMLQREKEKYLIQYQRSRSPKCNPEDLQRKVHRSHEKKIVDIKDEQIFRTISKNSYKMPLIKKPEVVLNHRSSSPSFLLEAKKFSKKDSDQYQKLIKKERVVPRFIMNKTRMRSKSPGEPSMKALNCSAGAPSRRIMAFDPSKRADIKNINQTVKHTKLSEHCSRASYKMLRFPHWDNQ